MTENLFDAAEGDDDVASGLLQEQVRWSKRGGREREESERERERERARKRERAREREEREREEREREREEREREREREKREQQGLNAGHLETFQAIFAIFDC